MAIIKVGEIFQAKFGGRTEPKVEVALAGLEVMFSVLKPSRNIGPDDKFRLTLKLTKEQHDEIRKEVLKALEALNQEGGYGASKKQLEDLLERAIGESTREEGVYRFYGSKKMGFMDRDSEKMVPFSMVCIDGATGEEIEGGVALGAGSAVRSTFLLSLFRKDKQVLLNINPNSVTVLKKVEPPKRSNVSHEGLEDAYGF